MASVAHLLEITNTVAAETDQKIDRIHGITRRSRMLALNASIEAQRVGQLGRGFAVVAEEVKAISTEISQLTDSLRGDLKGKLATLSDFGRSLATDFERVRGERLADLAHNAVEIADRNLYERSCDVRWWATDPAMVDCAAHTDDSAKAHHAGKRLGVILDSYTVYLDLWIADAQGRVIASGRPGRYNVIGTDVSGEQWFKDAMATHNGGEFAVADITRNSALGNAVVATYATAIRAEGDANGAPIGALGIFFDWQAQGRSIVEGVRLSPEEKAKSRCLIIDSNHRIIADSAGHGTLTEHFPLDTRGGERGWYMDNFGTLVGYALTPGYETYAGLGWYGILLQEE
ncbi:MAG: chemotaxis protein [Rhodospirillaceae bacterium]|nr:chemotaxis protein [Rhodospirillales bacterium]